MSISFQKLLTDCLVAMGDKDATTWTRSTQIWSWAIMSMLEFPILRPMEQSVTIAVAATHQTDLAVDFREMITVEYPLSQDPPEYLIRKNRLDPNFYGSDDYYDVDRNYVDGKGWILWTSKLMPVAAQFKINYLANHKTDLLDDPTSYITVPDEYEGIIVSNVVSKGYRERMGSWLIEPTAHTAVLQQLVEAVTKAEDMYKWQVEQAVAKLTEARVSPVKKSDKYDRAY